MFIHSFSCSPQPPVRPWLPFPFQHSVFFVFLIRVIIFFYLLLNICDFVWLVVYVFNCNCILCSVDFCFSFFGSFRRNFLFSICLSNSVFLLFPTWKFIIYSLERYTHQHKDNRTSNSFSAKVLIYFHLLYQKVKDDDDEMNNNNAKEQTKKSVCVCGRLSMWVVIGCGKSKTFCFFSYISSNYFLLRVPFMENINSGVFVFPLGTEKKRKKK